MGFAEEDPYLCGTGRLGAHCLVDLAAGFVVAQTVVGPGTAGPAAQALVAFREGVGVVRTAVVAVGAFQVRRLQDEQLVWLATLGHVADGAAEIGFKVERFLLPADDAPVSEEIEEHEQEQGPCRPAGVLPDDAQAQGDEHHERGGDPDDVTGQEDGLEQA